MVRVRQGLEDYSAPTEICYNYLTKFKRKLRPPFKSLISGKVFNDNWFSGTDLGRLSVVSANRQGSSFSHTNWSQLSLRRKLLEYIKILWMFTRKVLIHNSMTNLNHLCSPNTCDITDSQQTTRAETEVECNSATKQVTPSCCSGN